MNAAEIIMAGEFQLEAAGGIEETPFVTVKVTQGQDGNVSVEGFQVSQQCMAMVAEEALEIDTNPGFCKVNETFTAIQEGKGSKTVENNFFLTVGRFIGKTRYSWIVTNEGNGMNFILLMLDEKTWIITVEYRRSHSNLAHQSPFPCYCAGALKCQSCRTRPTFLSRNSQRQIGMRWPRMIDNNPRRNSRTN